MRRIVYTLGVAAILAVGCGVAALAASGENPPTSSSAVASLGTHGSAALDGLTAEADLRAEWEAEVAAGTTPDDLPAALSASLQATAERHGYTVVSVSTISGRELAPIVALTTTDPVAAVQDMQSLSNDLFGVPSRYEAYYLTVSDTSGVPVYTRAASFRTGIGHTQIRSSLDTRSGMAPPP